VLLPGKHINDGFAQCNILPGVSVLANDQAPLALSKEVLAWAYVAVVLAIQNSRHRLREATWVEEQFAMPSLFARVDHIGKSICEVELRPNGVGVVATALPSLNKRLYEVRARCWHGLKVVVAASPERTALVDDARAGLTVVRTASLGDLPDDALCIVRADPQESAFVPFQPRSVSPITSDGDRQYGIDVLWDRFDPTRVDWNVPFVVKGPGTRSEAVYFWDPASMRQESFLKTLPDAELIVQPRFEHAPNPYARVVHENGDVIPYATLHRSFFFFNVRTFQWEHAATCWAACPTPPVHGTPELVLGPVRFV
jgi:hypothetical protein